MAAAAAFAAFAALLAALDLAITLRSEEFRRFLVAEAGRRLDADIAVLSARFEPVRGLLLEGIDVRPRSGVAPSLVRLRFDAAVRPRYRSLLAGRIEIARVRIEALELDVARDAATGGYAFDGLFLPSAGGGSGVPSFEIDVEDAAITIDDPLFLAPGERARIGRLDATASIDAGGRLHARGSAEAGAVGPLRFAGEIDTARGDVSASMSAPALAAGPEIESLLAPSVAEPLRRLGLTGPASASVSIAGDIDGAIAVDASLELGGMTVRPEAVPYPLDDVRGVLRLAHGRLGLVGLSGRHDATSVSLDGEVAWPEAGPPEVRLDARVQALSIDEELRRALPPEGREAFEILRPSGTADVAVRIDGAIGGAEPPAVRFDVELFDASLTYVGTYHEAAGMRLGFPYPMNRVNGHVRNDGEETSISLRGYAGHAPFSLDGRLHGNPLDPGVDLVVDAKGAVLDETLRSALDEDARGEWDRFRPSGIADVRCRIFQDPGSKTNTDAHVTLRGAAAEFVGFPYPMSGLSGVVRIVNADVFVEGVTGRSGGMSVTVDGTFYGSGLAAAHAVTVDAKDVLVDAPLVKAVRAARPEIAARLERMQAGGLADVLYREVRGAFEETETRIDANMKDVRIRPEGIPMLLSGVRGALTITDSEIGFRGVSGAFGESAAGAFRVEGRIDILPDGGAIEIEAAASGIPLDEELRTAIGIGAAAGGAVSLVAARSYDTLRPSGVVGLRGAFAGTLETPRVVSLELDLAGTRVAPSFLPHPVEAEGGTISIESGGGFRLSLSSGRFGLATIARLSASGAPSPEGYEFSADLGVFGLPIEPALIASATGLRIADVEAMKPGGRLDVDRLHVDVAWRDGEPVVVGRGRLELADARIDGGVALTSIRGFVDVEEFHRDASGYRVVGRIEDLSAELLKARLSSVGGRIHAVPHYVRLEGIGGSIYGGSIDPESTRVVLHTSEPADWAGRLVIRGFELEALAAALSPKEPEFRGRADLDVEFRKGAGSGASSVIARGTLDVTDGSLVDIPFVAAIFRVLAPPVGAKYSTANARFRLRRSKFVIDEIRFGGAPISLEGYGRFDLDGTLDLLLVMGLPRLLAIPIIDDLVRLLSQSLVAIRVAGPSDNPRVFVENVVTEGFAPDLVPVRRPKGLAFEERRRPAEW